MSAKRRARTEEQKQQRRQMLLDTAWGLLQADVYEDIGIAAVARTAGLAKGTVYLYFQTKEELFLNVQKQQIGAWLDAVDAELTGLQGSGDIAGVAGVICRSLCERPAMVHLLSKLHMVLEQNSSYESVLQFKRMLLARITRTGALLEACLPFLAPAGGVRLCMWYYTFVLGLEQVANPAPVVKEVIANEANMAAFDLDFSNECRAVMTALLCGLKAAAKDNTGGT